MAYGSIAYAAGFCVVTLHTGWQLGLPMLDLPQSRYVVVGAPVAAATFVAKPLWSYLVDELRRQAKQVRDAMQKRHLARLNADLDFFATVFEILVRMVLPSAIVTRVLREWFLKLLDTAASKVTEQREKASRLFDFALRGLQLYLAVVSILNLVAGALVVAALLVGYVVVFYPLLPQTFGGGAPYRVRLVLDAAKISPELGQRVGLPMRWQKESAPVITTPVNLLYNSTDGLWLRRDGHPAFFVEKSVVLAKDPD